MKIEGALWYSQMGNPFPIGIVWGADEVTGEKKAYIGVGAGGSEELDAHHIAETGAKFNINALPL